MPKTISFLSNSRLPLQIQSKLLIALLALVVFVNQANASVGGWLFETNRKLEALIAGLEQHTKSIDDTDWFYYVKNSSSAKNKTCTVLIHGFTAEASHWFRFARGLEHDECVVIPDLPGFGRSSYKTGEDYTVKAQVNRLHSFLAALDLADQYHLAGSSMGGHIIGLYAVKFPSNVKSLTLINAGGVKSPEKSHLDVKVEATGRSVFEVESQEEYKSMLKASMSEPPWMPFMVRNHLADKAIAQTPKHKSIFSKLYQQDMLDQKLLKIKAPTLIVWGDQDQLLHPSMAEVFHKGIYNSDLVVMPGIGHLPFLEEPGHTADLFNQFIAKHM